MRERERFPFKLLGMNHWCIFTIAEVHMRKQILEMIVGSTLVTRIKTISKGKKTRIKSCIYLLISILRAIDIKSDVMCLDQAGLSCWSSAYFSFASIVEAKSRWGGMPGPRSPGRVEVEVERGLLRSPYLSDVTRIHSSGCINRQREWLKCCHS